MSADLTLLARYQEIQTRIATAAKRASRDPASIGLIAVSKVHPYEKIRTLYDAGHRDFGENYVQELIEKSAQAKAEGLKEIRWHFLGHLQTNKVKVLLPHVTRIHGVGSLRLAEEIEKRSAGRRISILLEVNIDAEESKSGVQISELRSLVEGIQRLRSLHLQGLMCIPNPARASGTREAFRRLAALAADFQLPELSMGMTADFEEAILEGATWVRVGTAIFGERSQT